MNHVIDALKNHRSIRSFLDKPVSDEQIHTIIKATQAAPSSINGQQVSIIAIKNQVRRENMSEYGSYQWFIKEAPLFLLFCVDYHRASIACEKVGEKIQAQNCLETTLVGAVDVGIYTGFATIAAESLGLGTVIVGGLRDHLEEVTEFVELPPLVYPLVGIAIGYPADVPPLKPRLPEEAVFFNEKYDKTRLPELIDQYDRDFLEYTKNRGGDAEPHTWSDHVAAVYANEYYHNVPELIKKQGFGFD